MHVDFLAHNISSNKRHSFCSIYLSVISDLLKTRSQHITQRKTLLIDMCDRCIHAKTLTTSYQESLSESSVAVQMQVDPKTLTTSYQESISESSVAVQMHGGCVNAHVAVIATSQAPAICHRAIATVQALAMC